MNSIPLTREQQDLIELLTQELLTQLDDSLSPHEDPDHALQQLNGVAECAANFAEAAELIGLQGLAEAWRCIEQNFNSLAALTEINPEQQLLIDSWSIYFLDYLQKLSESDISADTITGLLEYLSNDAWPEPLSSERQQSLGKKLATPDIPAFDDTVHLLPHVATMDMLSLHLSEEINPELFEGLMIELPVQVNTFTEQIGIFIASRDKTALASAQRIAHTLKGSGNVVGVTGLANFMHYAEDLLEEIARQNCAVTPALKDLLIDMTDTLASMLDCLLVGEMAGEVELGVMQQVLNAYHAIRADGVDAYLGRPDYVQIAPTSGEHSDAAMRDAYLTDSPLEGADTATQDHLVSETDFIKSHDVNARQNIQETIASHLRIKEESAQDLLRLAGTSAIATNRLQTQVHGMKGHLQHIGQLHQKLGALTEEFGQLIEVKELFSNRHKAENNTGLDPLELDRYNELHSFFHQLQEFITDARDAIHQTQVELRGLEEQTYEQLVTNRESQNLLLEMRMVPASTMEARFQRCVRQSARLTGKTARFELLGGDTMVDSRVLHELIDPVMHLLRNAVDHGIESSEARHAVGKAPEGVVSLQFRTQGQFILVQVRDDGAGLHHERIAAKAEQLSLTPPDGNNMEHIERWLNQLIFVPGFSTSQQISQTSGRGIGLDMVADRISELKGRINVDSHPGVGCEFTIRLPMTMIAEHGLLIRSGENQLVISSRGVEQLLFLEPNDITNDGEHLQYTFNDEVMDVYHIAHLANLPDTIALSAADARALIVVESFPGQRVGILVETVSASREMVIKPLTPFTPAVPGVIGATILGNGAVAPVVDVQQLVLDMLKTGLQSAAWKSSVDILARQTATVRPIALVVDDSLSTRRSLAQFVADIGMDVRTAKDGFEAVDILQEQTPTVILVDMEMPRMNGLEFTAHVRANEATKHIPVIMITSRNTEKHRSLARAAGVDNYLNKPFSEDELLHCLQESIHV